MNSRSLKHLLQSGINTKFTTQGSSVRSRKGTKSQSQDHRGKSRRSEMVPKIVVAPYDDANLIDNKIEEKLDEWTENEESKGSFTKRSKLNEGYGTLNGDAFVHEGSDQVVPLLEDQGPDDFTTEISGTIDTTIEEGSFAIGLQVFFPFLIAGFGTVSAGILLDVVQVGTFSTDF